jgi:lysozyme
MALNNYHRTAIGAMALSAVGLVHISMQEGFVAVATPPVKGDVPTYGFGTTEGVKLGDKITPEKALNRELSDISKFEGAIKECVKVPLYQREYDAYTSLTYNIGTYAFCHSTIVKNLNLGNYTKACEGILDWDKFKGRPLKGLTNRRQSEYHTCTGVQA